MKRTVQSMYSLVLSGILFASSPQLSAGGDFPEALREVVVSSSQELFFAAAEAEPGTHIIVKDGTYAIPFTFDRQGTEEAPIVIRAENRLGALFTSRVTLSGSHIIVSGLRVEGPGMTLQGNYNRISRCRIHLAVQSGACVFVNAGRGGRIDRCEMTVEGDFLADETVGGWRFSLSGINLNHANHFDLRIDRNYFHGWPSRLSHQPYTLVILTIVRIGSHQGPTTPQPNALVEYNLFENNHKTDHYMSKSIHFKTGGNLARFNTVIDSERSLIDSRSGWDNKFYGNWMENSGGFQTFDADHEVLGNVLINTTIGMEIMAGDTMEYDTDILQARSYNVFLAGNESHRLVVGRNWSNHGVPARDIVIEAHNGPVTLALEQNTVIREETDREIPQAVKLDRSMVGPDAPGDDETETLFPVYGDWQADNEQGDVDDTVYGLGRINILHAPWVYLQKTDSWVYVLPEHGGWFYLPSFEDAE